jgi:hypothetical protein
MYYTAIGIDLLLRCTWSFKLSPHLDHFNDLEGGIFLMELLEVMRRWMWIFFRVETEWGESGPVLILGSILADSSNTYLAVRNNRGPAPDDILLGDFAGKIDDD